MRECLFSVFRAFRALRDSVRGVSNPDITENRFVVAQFIAPLTTHHQNIQDSALYGISSEAHKAGPC